MKPAPTSAQKKTNRLIKLTLPIGHVKAYVKPSCITCKRALSEIERLNLDLEKRDIFSDRLTEAEIKRIVKMAKIKPRDLLRKRDKMYRNLSLEGKNLSDSELVSLMAKHPGLIRRPIIVGKDGVLIGKADPKDLKSL